MTFVYSDSTAVVGPLAGVREPHSWDLCVSHAGRITAPRGWELVRHSGPLPTHPEDEDLVALANAVREAGPDRMSAPGGWFPHPSAASPGAAEAGGPTGYGAVLAPPGQQPKSNGRRRGHLRVLPDPSD